MKNIIIALVMGVGLIGGAYYLVSNGKTEAKPANLNNVEIVDGKQIIQIDVKGGYSPKKSIAQAGIPTILRFNTKGTFDCSSSISLPSLGINKVLPNTGSTDFDIGSPVVGVLEGRCSMGMYFFSIDFQG
jgi:plastocyanin domain-containing protein